MQTANCCVRSTPSLARSRRASDSPRRRTMPRKATGTLIYTKEKGWCARIPVIVGHVDGKPVREKQWFELGTESRTLAKRKVAKIIADNANGKIPSPDDVKRAETFAEACERVH